MICIFNKNCIIKIIFTIAVICLILTNFTYAKNIETDKALINEQYKLNGIEKINDYLDNNFSDSISGYYNPQDILKDSLKGNLKFNIPGFLNKALKYLFKEFYINLSLFIKLIVLAILCAILKNLQASFLSKSVGELAFYVCYVVIISIVVLSFNTVIVLAQSVIDNMVNFMYLIIPILVTLLISGGNIVSAGIFQPLLIGMAQVAATIFGKILIPITFFVGVLSIVNNISDKIQISRLTAFLKQINMIILGVILTLFVGVISIQGTMGATVDGVTSKATKFAIGTFIPVAGKYLADAADSVISCTLLIKNAAGVAIMLIIILCCLAPILKIFALVLIYRISCVVLEPLGESRIVNCLNDVASSMSFIIGIVAAVAFMFLVSITVVISASNVSAMFR